MSQIISTLRQARYENLAFWRNPASAFFTFAFPLMFLVIFTSIFGSGEVPVAGGIRVSTSTFYVTAILSFSVITACYTNIAISVTFSRDEGVLKRVHGTPLPPWSYLMGKVLHSMFLMVLLVVIVVAFGALFYDAEPPTDNLGIFLLTLSVGAATFCVLGLAITAACPNAEAAPAVVNASILPLLFISDIFIPLDQAPEWLTTVSGLFPVIHFAEAMQAAYFDPTGTAFEVSDLIWVAGWGLAGLILAVRFFSWEPRR